jgi:glycosyltransferase involved in cell wall biosynthesis
VYAEEIGKRHRKDRHQLPRGTVHHAPDENLGDLLAAPCVVDLLMKPDASPSSDIRIVIVAEHASLQFGGEAALPLHYFRVLRKRGIEAWLVTHVRTRAELLFSEDGARILFVPDTWMHRALWRVGTLLPRRIQDISTGLLMRLLTQLVQRRIVKRLVREKRISVVHQPIPVSPKEPSLMYGLGAPVVIGPMNGGMTFPPAFRNLEPRWISFSVSVSRALSHLANAVLPGKRRAAVLLVANERTRAALPRGASSKVIELVENGVDVASWTSSPRRDEKPDDITRFIFMGRLLDLKAVDLLLSAFHAAAPSAPMSMAIVGDGPERAKLHALAYSLGILSSDGKPPHGTVQFLGWKRQRECAEILRNCDCLVLPSLHECGGAVILEAMCMGLPVIAADWGGPADYIDTSCGILVPPRSREGFVEGLREALVSLAKSPERRKLLGTAGRKKVMGEFDWDVKLDKILTIYETVMAASAAAARVEAGNAIEMPRIRES